MIYFNDNEQFVVPWLGNLFPGATVDGRSVEEVTADDVAGYTRCHFFAGIGGWEYALTLAQWPETSPVWTASLPCQPFSSAGKRMGVKDERHLWPVFGDLVEQCRPPVIFGEQVASKAGREWLAGVRADLEALGYAVGAADLCAASAGAPHIRQRLYWVAYAQRHGLDGSREAGPRGRHEPANSSGDAGGVAYANPERQQGVGLQLQSGEPRQASPETAGGSEAGGVAYGYDDGRDRAHEAAAPEPDSYRQNDRLPERDGAGAGGVGDTDCERPQGWFLRRDGTHQRIARPSGLGPWGEFDVIECADGKARRIPVLESGVFPVVDGATARVGRIRAYGGAIVPQVAAEFIRAFMEAVDD